MEPKNKSKLPVLTMLLVALLVLVGTSYAYFDYSFIGKDNTISTTDVSIKLLESNKEIVTLENQLPMSDEQGINQVGTGNVFDFAVETKSSSDMKLGYKLNIEKLKADTGYTSLTDDQIKIYLTDTNDNKILGPLKISDLENYNLYEDVNIHSKTNNTQVDKYRIRVWIDQDVQIKDWDENTKQQYKFKIGVGSAENEGNYIITYNSNGGEGTMAASIYNKNTTNTLRKNTFTRGGYTFKGWSTTNNGEVEYQDQNTATNLTQNQNDQNKTLYAVWKPNTYTVKYHPNTKEIRTEEDVTIDVNYYPEGGENPYKWQLNNGVYESSDTPSSSGEPQSYSKTSNTKSLANEYIKSIMYKEISLSEEKQLEFDCAMTYGILKIYIRGEGGKYLDSVTINYNELIEGEYNPIVITLPKETRYIAFAYTDEIREAPAAYQEDDENSPITKKLETTTAAHKAYIKNIKLISNDNNGIKTSTFTVGQNNKLKKNNWIKKHYTFKGWNTNKNETNIKYQDESDLTNLEKTVKEQGQIDLYAIWEINKYNVNVVVQNGTINGDSTKQIEYNKNGVFNLTSNIDSNRGKVTCTNGQSGILENGVLTIKNVSSDTTCTAEFIDSATTLYEDGTLIINEKTKNRSANISTHGAVTNEYDAMSESNSYVITISSDQPWYSKRNFIKNIEIGQKIEPMSTANWFSSLSNMEKGDFTNLDASSVTNMREMFGFAGDNATTFELKGLENWNTSSVTDMREMFYYAGSDAATWTIGDISKWDVSNVINMRFMFYEAGYNSTTFNLNLSNWNTSSVTKMYGMFYEAGSKATTWSIGDISNWNTSNVTDMSRMFYYAGNSATTWNIGDISNWNTSNVTDMSRMFFKAGSNATTWSIGDLSTWNTSSVVSMSEMFYYAGNSATTWNIGDISNWNTSSVVSMSHMFHSAGSKATTWSIGDLSNWDVSSVTNMEYMFYEAGYNSTTFNLNLSNWNTSSVTDMNYMFDSAGFRAKTWSVTIPKTTGSLTNETYKWYGSSSSVYASPSNGRLFTINNNVDIVVQNGALAEGESSTKKVPSGSKVSFRVIPNDSNLGGVVSCTNNQIGTIKDNIITIENVTNDTTCTVNFVSATTTLYTDGTLIVNESPNDRNNNITTHGAVANDMMQ